MLDEHEPPFSSEPNRNGGDDGGTDETASDEDAVAAAETVVDGDLRKPIRTLGDLVVRGNIRENLRAAVGGRLQVVGWILSGSELYVAGDVEVLGGIETSNLHVDGSLSAAILDGCTVRVGQALNVQERIQDCDICVLGPVAVPDGQIVGGQIIATDFVTCETLGESPRQLQRRDSQHPRTTVVQISRSAARELFEIDLDMRISDAEAAVAQMEHLWQPLLEDEGEQQGFSEEERAELELRKKQIKQARERLAQLEQRYRTLEQHVRDRTSRSPRISIGKALYPGAEVRMWDRALRFRKTVEGPVTVSPTYQPPAEAVWGEEGA